MYRSKRTGKKIIPIMKVVKDKNNKDVRRPDYVTGVNFEMIVFGHSCGKFKDLDSTQTYDAKTTTMYFKIDRQDVIDALNSEGWPVNPGDLGENITLTNIDYSILKPGDRLNIGEVSLEISLICDPCTNLNNLPYVGKDKSTSFIKTLMKRRGWYARVLKVGKVTAGDSVTLVK